MTPESTNPEVALGQALRNKTAMPAERPFSSLPGQLEKIVCDIIPECVSVCLLLLVVAGTEKMIEFFMGDKARFFDYVPVKWVFDLDDLAMVLLFFWRTVRKFATKESS